MQGTAKKATTTRIARLTRRRYDLLVEAICLLGAAAAAVRFLPFRHAVRLGSIRLAGTVRTVDDVAGDVGSAVRTAARLAPWRAVCIEQGIALQRMLRRRGVDARLHYGIANDDGGKLAAHVWVSDGDQVILGGNEAPQFQHVATFP